MGAWALRLKAPAACMTPIVNPIAHARRFPTQAHLKSLRRVAPFGDEEWEAFCHMYRADYECLSPRYKLPEECDRRADRAEHSLNDFTLRPMIHSSTGSG